MTAVILDGKKVAGSIQQKIQAREVKAKLAVVQVGENAASAVYIKKKEEMARSLGIGFKLYSFPENISQKQLEDEIKAVAEDAENTGIILQLPLPEAFNAEELVNLIPEHKDVDVLSGKAFEKFTSGDFPIIPPTISAISELLKQYGISVKGKNVVIIGRGRLVGLPARIFFERTGAHVAVAHSQTENLNKVVQKADIVISGAGKAGLITGDMIKEGAVVIDAGTSVQQGKSLGDVDFASVSKKASYISPVPGGVGPVTVACLFSNLVKLS